MIAAAYDQPFGNSSVAPAYYCARMAKEAGIEHMLAGRRRRRTVRRQHALRLAARLRRSTNTSRSLCAGRCWNRSLLGWPMPARIPVVRKAVGYVEQARVPMPDRLQRYNLLTRIGLAEILSPGIPCGRGYRGAVAPAAARVWRVQRAVHDQQDAGVRLEIHARGQRSSQGRRRRFTRRHIGGLPVSGRSTGRFLARAGTFAQAQGAEAALVLQGGAARISAGRDLSKKKHGFGLPFGVWLTRHAGLQELAFDSLSTLGTRGFVRPEFLDKLRNEYLSRHPAYYGELVWILVMFEQWLRAATAARTPRRVAAGKRPMTAAACTAVVVGADLNALGLARSLAAGDMPIVIVGDRSGGPAMDSRHGRKVGVAETAGEALLAALTDIASHAAEQPVLVSHRGKVGADRVGASRPRPFRFSHPAPRARPADGVDAQDRASRISPRRRGASLPRALPLQTAADLAAVAQLRFPCVLKPARKDYAYGARFQKAYVVANIDDVRRLFGEIAPVMSDLVVQEWIEGDDSDIHFCLVYMGDRGELVSSFSGRKLRSWPPPDWRHGELHQRGGSRRGSGTPDGRVLPCRRLQRNGHHGVQARPSRRQVPDGRADGGPHRFPGGGRHGERREHSTGGLLVRDGRGALSPAACRRSEDVARAGHRQMGA